MLTEFSRSRQKALLTLNERINVIVLLLGNLDLNASLMTGTLYLEDPFDKVGNKF